MNSLLSILSFTTVFLLLPVVGSTHWEDPAGCSAAHQRVRDAGEDSWQKIKEGMSLDGRDYVVTWKSGNMLTEEHYQLAPKAQWESPDSPAVLPSPLSEWVDWDGDGFFGEWFLFPRGQAACEDALHFIWSDQLQVYILYAKGKERT